MSDEQQAQQTQQADDPSGDGWRDVEPDELLQDGDMLKNNTGLWLRTRMPGRLAREGYGGTYRRRIAVVRRESSLGYTRLAVTHCACVSCGGCNARKVQAGEVSSHSLLAFFHDTLPSCRTDDP